MADHELRPEEGLQLLDEVFGSASAPPTRGRRKYVLVAFSPKILRHDANGSVRTHGHACDRARAALRR